MFSLEVVSLRGCQLVVEEDPQTTKGGQMQMQGLFFDDDLSWVFWLWPMVELWFVVNFGEFAPPFWVSW